MVWSSPVEPDMLIFMSPIFRSKGWVVIRPSLIEKRTATSLASIFRSLSLSSALASASNASRFWIRMFADLISPVASSDCRSGSIFGSSAVVMSSDNE